MAITTIFEGKTLNMLEEFRKSVKKAFNGRDFTYFGPVQTNSDFHITEEGDLNNVSIFEQTTIIEAVIQIDGKRTAVKCTIVEEIRTIGGQGVPKTKKNELEHSGKTISCI